MNMNFFYCFNTNGNFAIIAGKQTAKIKEIHILKSICFLKKESLIKLKKETIEIEIKRELKLNTKYDSK